MPAWAPVRETAGTSSECKAMAVSAMVVCSPVASSMSISRSLGSGMISLASLMRLSVTPLMAETTTTIWSPCARYRATRAATFLIRSVLPTELPPYFWTIMDISQSNHLHDRFFFRFDHDRFEAGGGDRRVGIFKPVTGHRCGKNAARRNHPSLNALDKSRQWRGTRGFDKYSFRARDQFVGIQNLRIGYLVDVTPRFLERLS